ncbi:MAG: addiction module protein [bacterium]
MKQLTATDTLTLSIPERIQLVEDIWDTIVVEPVPIELTEGEKRIIDQRLSAYHKNPNLGSPWEDVYKRLVSKG